MLHLLVGRSYFGLVSTIAPYWLQAGGALAPPQVMHAAVPLGMLATAVLVVNNLRDRHTDVVAGKRTLAVRFGGRFARAQYAFLVGGAYVALLVAAAREARGAGLTGTATGAGPLCAAARWLLPFLSTPAAAAQLRAVCVEKDGAALNAHVGGTAKFQLLFGLLLAVGTIWL